MDKRITILKEKYDLPNEIWWIINECLEQVINLMMHPTALLKIDFKPMRPTGQQCWREMNPNPNEIVRLSHCFYEKPRGKVKRCHCKFCIKREAERLIPIRADSIIRKLFEF